MDLEQLALKKKNTRQRSIGGKLQIVEISAEEEIKHQEADDIDDDWVDETEKTLSELPSALARIW